MLFEMKGVRKRYGSLVALAGLDLEVEKGEIVGLLGPNGAGKTTALKISALLLNRESGELLYRGVPVESIRTVYLSNLGYVPENSIFYEDLTVEEVLEMMGALRGRRDLTWERDLLSRFNLDGKVDNLISELSKGQKRGLSIVIALQHKPNFLLLDEPTSGLDPGHTYTFKGLIKEAAKKGAGVLLSTHITSLAEDVCDRVAIIKEGRVAAGPAGVEELLEVGETSNLEELFLKVVGE
ncbi:MAG: ABC transporter ATP-binding protein [Thermoplasmata archaeon]|nr:ABC transporter ATP-binding protein [Thermoplasmata archaeon]